MVISTRVFACFCLFFFKYGRGVRLILGPVNYAASPSEHVRLRCEITEKGSAEIIWKYGSKTILNYDRRINRLLDPKLGRRYFITPSFGNSFDLNIIDVQVTDIGMYTCGYISDKRVFILQSAKLDVFQDTTTQVYPHCYADQSLDMIAPYDSVDLNCDAGSNAPSTTQLTWSKHGATLVSLVGEYYLSHNIVLSHDDYGIAYICNVTDLLTGQYRTCRIVPLIFPQKTSLTVQIKTTTTKALVGTDVVFTCNVQGLKPTERPRYSWSTTNNGLLESRRVHTQNQRKILKITNIQLGDDVSRFTCEVITDTRRRGSTQAVLYVPSPRVTISPPRSKTTNNYVPRTYTTSTGATSVYYFTETTKAFVPKINNQDRMRSHIGLGSGLAGGGVLILIFVIIIAVVVIRRKGSSKRNEDAPTESEAVLHDASTVNDRFSFMQLFTRFSRNFSRPNSNKKEQRRVRFAPENKSDKSKREPFYDPVAIDEETPKNTRRFFRKPKIFFEYTSSSKTITKNMSNNCSVKSESRPVTCVCVVDNATGKVSLVIPDVDDRRRTHPGSLDVVNKDKLLTSPKLPKPGLELVYADLEFHEKTYDSPTLMQVLLRLDGNEYAEIKNMKCKINSVI